MINQNFGILAAILALIGSLNYAWSTFKGHTQPNRMTWSLWMLYPGIAFAIELSEHVHLQVTLLTLSECVGPLLVLIASGLNKAAFWKISNFDKTCGVIAIGSLILWVITKDSSLALVFNLVGSLFSSTPTIIKAYKFPETESPGDYVASTVAGVITLLTIHIWNVGNYGFPVYITFESFILSSLVLLPRLLHKRVSSSLPTMTFPKAPGSSYNHPVMLGVPIWSSNPVEYGSPTRLQVPIEYLNGIVIGGEFFIGNKDPGEGQGTTMEVHGSYLTAEIDTADIGSHVVSIRAYDNNNIWSDIESSVLIVMPVAHAYTIVNSGTS